MAGNIRVNKPIDDEKIGGTVGKDDIILQREQTVVEREQVIAEKELIIHDREQVILEREKTILDREDTILSREHEITRLQELIIGLRDEVRQKLDNLNRQEARLQKTGQQATQSVRTQSTTVVSGEFALSEHFDAELYFTRWDERIERFKAINLVGSQKLIPPYIVEKQIYDRQYRFFIGTEEGRLWYDKPSAFEAHQAQELKMIRPGDTVFDCGANQGINALIYSSLVGPAGKVISFDPFPLNIEICQMNADLNGRDNIKFEEVGLSNEPTSVGVSILEQCVQMENQSASDIITIKLEPLDKYAHYKPNYLKIDVEGAEVDALAGACNILETRPYLYIEVHPGFLPRFGKKPMDIFKYISLDDYQCFMNYPGYDPLSVYEGEFDLAKPCALYLVPRSQPPVVRYYPQHS